MSRRVFFFLFKPQKSLRKTRQCYTIPPRSLSYWTPARCECELSTRQHLFSEPLCPFSVLHVVRPLNPKKKMKRLRFLCFGFVMMIYSLIWNAAEGQSAGCYCFCSLSLLSFFLKLPPCRKHLADQSHIMCPELWEQDCRLSISSATFTVIWNLSLTEENLPNATNKITDLLHANRSGSTCHYIIFLPNLSTLM